ncbi:MAG: hypothetical protein ACE5H9_09345 [Anaerolineae bacterium]
MKPTRLFLLIVVGLLVACGPGASPATVEVEPQVLSPVVEQPTRPPGAATVEVRANPSAVIASPEPAGETAKPEGTAQVAPEASSVAFPPKMEDSERGGKRGEVPGDIAIRFQRSGGFAGLNEQWIIYRDGRVDGPGGERRRVTPEEVQMLLETIHAAGFFDLRESYVPLDTCCDRFFYTLTVQFGGKTKTVNTLDASPTQPEELTRVMNAIGEFLFAPD